ncbi:hypothetical protein BU24DRAFT_404043 [Aaosphaeria arxii CBS 175.79]|uniref:Tudor domain-containing protein n=1 Tax=Aaosphaeria arxii CBS 175.79 TaxID=1450172 RepID=A0A6A5Y8A9_9PLEO|nr:uncharacterized protein BU24DRAFT_404043 [Aaosphaeria arxii CBS 175.79]KAF2020981.1 hypothetical protein BU24DRAFT_404043 [Aaosphaeria arxii CBS 175.79]
MADRKTIQDLKETKAKLEDERAQRDQWASLLPEAENGTSEESQALAAEIRASIAQQDAAIASLSDKLSALQKQLPESAEPDPAAPKFDPEKHPMLRKAVEKVEPAKPVNFNTGDICEVLWTDKSWYRAKVQTVLGSVSDPKYRIRFLEYEESITVGRDSIRPLPNEKKRKAEVATVPTPPPVAQSPHVISGPASINPEALAAKKDPAPDNAAPPPRRKIGGHKALERKANDWKAFTTKGVGKQIGKKDSMFRSGTTVNSRVGFTGSGAGMTKTNKRVRYNNKDKDEDEDTMSNRHRTDDYQPRSRY